MTASATSNGSGPLRRRNRLYRLDASTYDASLFEHSWRSEGCARSGSPQRPDCGGWQCALVEAPDESHGETGAEMFDRAERELNGYRRLPGQSIATYLASMKRLKAQYGRVDPGSFISDKAWYSACCNEQASAARRSWTSTTRLVGRSVLERLRLRSAIAARRRTKMRDVFRLLLRPLSGPGLRHGALRRPLRHPRSSAPLDWAGSGKFEAEQPEDEIKKWSRMKEPRRSPSARLSQLGGRRRQRRLSLEGQTLVERGFKILLLGSTELGEDQHMSFMRPEGLLRGDSQCPNVYLIANRRGLLRGRAANFTNFTKMSQDASLGSDGRPGQFVQGVAEDASEGGRVRWLCLRCPDARLRLRSSVYGSQIRDLCAMAEGRLAFGSCWASGIASSAPFPKG